MKSPSDPSTAGKNLRESLIGLGEHSLRKSYYPELQQRLADLERFKIFIDHSIDAIFLIEVPSARIVDTNEAPSRLLGWQPEELLGRSLFDLTELADNHQVRALIGQTGPADSERILVETVLYQRDGTGIAAEVTIARLLFKERNYAIAVARNIEKRKRAELALEERVRLAELGAEVGATLTKGGGLQPTLQGCAEALVRHCEAAFGRLWVPSDDDPTLLVLQASAGQYTGLEGRHRYKKLGEELVGQIAEQRRPYLTNALLGNPGISNQDWVRREGMVAFAGYPLLVEARLVGVVALFFKRPMTDAVLSALSSVADELAVGIQRLRAEEALGQSEKQYHTLAEVSPVGIFYTDVDGVFRYVNERWCHLTGIPHDQALRGDGGWRAQPRDRQRTVAEWSAAAESVQSFRTEYPFLRTDGRSIWLACRVMAEKDAQGGVIGYVGTLADITDLKRAEEELRASEENRLKLQTQLELAAEVQAKLLPRSVPSLSGFEVAARCQPAQQVAGDFYDWQLLAAGRFSLTLGDVMGKGLAAAMLMATVRASLRAATLEHRPELALRQAAEALHQDLDGSDSFVTLFHAQLDLPSRRLSYVDCGHGHVFLRRGSGAVEELLPRGLPLGIFAGEGFQEGSLTLGSGDALVLYSDGLVDAFPGRPPEPEELAAHLTAASSAGEMVDRLIGLVPDDVSLPDDLTVLVVRCRD
ncbi:MAG TPA: SpoIIE family protein phosphatase [Geopsychrobacteraceae bacterium]|jgi:PAS domain S-box-containing protein